MAESAERKHSMQDLEHAMLCDMSDTKQARAQRFATLVITALDGLAPLTFGMLVLLPFLLNGFWSDIAYSYYAGLGMAMLALFGLGAFLARVAKDNVIRSGVRMIVAGAVCVALSLLLNANG
jgi:predicted membrane protein (TIGR00267 family)